jgi:hypothetical protein
MASTIKSSALLALPAELRMLVYKHTFDDAYIYSGYIHSCTRKGRPLVSQKLMSEHHHILLSCRLCYHEARVLFYSSAIWCFDMDRELRGMSAFYSFPPLQYVKHLFLYTDPFGNMGKHLRNLALKELPALEIVELSIFDMVVCTDRSISKCGTPEVLELICKKLNRKAGLRMNILAHPHVRFYVRATIHYNSEAPFQRILADLHNEEIFRATPFANRADWKKDASEEERDAQLHILHKSTYKTSSPNLNRFDGIWVYDRD